MEIWKEIEGFEGLYKISNQGRVLSLNYNKTRKEKILKPAKLKNGYLQVCFSEQGKPKFYLVHRLVANVFLPNPNNLEQVNHKNENKTDNRAENLEFCDAKYNSNYGTRNKRMAESNTNHPNKSKKVLCIETGKIYASTHQVERQLGFANTNISSACRGKFKTMYGYTWHYI